MRLHNCHILVVEDEYFLAEDLRYELEEAGAIVIGPEGSVKSALERVATEVWIDAAILDVNLGGEPVFPVAVALEARTVPFLFTSGYSNEAFPDRFLTAGRCSKPLNVRAVLGSLSRIVDPV